MTETRTEHLIDSREDGSSWITTEGVRRGEWWGSELDLDVQLRLDPLQHVGNNTRRTIRHNSTAQRILATPNSSNRGGWPVFMSHRVGLTKLA